MNTARIEEMVEEFTENYYSEGDDGGIVFSSGYNGQLIEEWVKQALTQVHQAGRDEAVEVVKSLIDHQAEYGGQPFGDIYNSAYKKVIEALQDKK